MISTKLSRVAAHRTATASLSSPGSTATQRATQCLANRRPGHQRRHSSSKPQSPPDNSKPAPTTKASATEDASQAPASEQRGRRKKAAGPSNFISNRSIKGRHEGADQFAKLPSVPGVQHMSEFEFELSSFFSLHRPLSVTTTVPPSSTPEQFNSIFESKVQPDSWDNGNSAERRPEQVIYSLHDTIEALENASGAQDDGVSWEVLQDDGQGIKHLDGAPRRKSLEDALAFKHFRVPPPPQPFSTLTPTAEKKKNTKNAKQPQPIRQESFGTMLVITKSTYADGQQVVTAAPSPIQRLPGPTQEETTSVFLEQSEPQPLGRQSFIERTRRRRHMQLISVKRQRKLKMKKHKYKKLMKRTRNLRRRQDRA